MSGALIAGAVTVGATLYSGRQSKKLGAEQNKESRARAERRAARLRQQAVQERASGQIASEEQKRRMEVLSSDAQATVSASGGGTIDPSIMRLIVGLSEEGQRASNVEKYQSETAAQGMEQGADQGIADGYQEGESARRAGNAAQRSSFASAAGKGLSMYAKYNSDAESDKRYRYNNPGFGE